MPITQLRGPNGQIVNVDSSSQDFMGYVKGGFTPVQSSASDNFKAGSGGSGINQPFQPIVNQAPSDPTPDQPAYTKNGQNYFKDSSLPTGYVKDSNGQIFKLDSTFTQFKASSNQGSSNSAVTTNKPQNKLFTESDAYKGLDQTSKDIVNYAFNLFNVGGENEATLFSKALASAEAIADPYRKAQLALIQGDVAAKIANENQNYQLESQIIQTTKQKILQDVQLKSNELTLDQQSELARLGRTYDQDILNIRDTAAAKGLTFGTGRVSAVGMEAQRTTDQNAVVESTNRKYNFQLQQLERQAQSGDIDAQNQLTRLNNAKNQNLQNIGRSAEQVLGSNNIPTGTGYTSVGGVTGTLEEGIKKGIIQDTLSQFQAGKSTI